MNTQTRAENNHEQVWGVLYPCLFEGHDSDCVEYIDKDGAVVHQLKNGAEEITGEQTVLCVLCRERVTSALGWSDSCDDCELDRAIEEQTLSDGMRIENKFKCSVCGEKETVTAIDRGAGGFSLWCDGCLSSDEEAVCL
jgi:hypothetical protein